MIVLPGTPFRIVHIQHNHSNQLTNTLGGNNNGFIQEILIKRLSINNTVPNNGNGNGNNDRSGSGNTTLLISSLEEYLNLIFKILIEVKGVEYNEVLGIASNVVLSDDIPWGLPITNGSSTNGLGRSTKAIITGRIGGKKKTDDDDNINEIQWTLADEIIIVLLNLINCYNFRSGELITTVLENEDMKLQNLNEKETQSYWLNSFKLLKNSIKYLNFLTKSISFHGSAFGKFYETSHSFIDLTNRLTITSIQLTFLTKSIWSLKKLEFDISKPNQLNYSTLSRISIFVKDELKSMINGLKSGNDNATSTWINYLENLTFLNNSYLGTLMSLECYKIDQIGKSIGFLNIAIDNLAKRENSNNASSQKDEFDEDSKLKKKFNVLKKKVSVNKSEKDNNDKIKKIKLNNKVFENLKSPALQKSITNLFKLMELLQLKYNLENNNLKFDLVPSTNELIQNHLPTGRSVPLSDADQAWIPDFAKRSGSETTENTQYY